MAENDFPIPEEMNQGFWMWDRLHAPRPLTPLEHELLVGATARGFTKAITSVGSMISVVAPSVNYYPYLHGEPIDIGSETKEARKARYDKNVAELMPRLGDLWRDEWLPAMQPKLARARATDYAPMSDDELIASFDNLRAEVDERWVVHGMLLYSFYAALVFADFYKEALQAEDEKEGYEALQGFETKTTESARGLWALSRSVRSQPELKQVFNTVKTDDLESRLGESDAGRRFLDDLRAYLEDFGWRAESVYELTRPSWREDPRIALEAVRGYLSVADGRGPDSQYESAVARREELLSGARTKLADDPEKLAKFNQLYDAASSFTIIVEDHNHWIDQMGDILLRYQALEIGRRLAGRGVIAKTDDVFMLLPSEIREAMAGKDWKTTIAERRAEMERFAKVVPPPVIGVPPPPSDPLDDVLFRFFGGGVEPSSDPSVINGTAASPGLVHGTAKVVLSLDEAGKLQQGDILVCEMTLPPWTSLFSTVGAVVADTGGILSHCAIIAREFRIPCVVGTGIGTTAIKDGMQLTVDGTRGVVRIDD